jgi:hypothetical protein
MKPGWRSSAPDERRYFQRGLPRPSSILAAIMVTVPITLVLSLTPFAPVGYVLLLGAAFATLVVAPPRRLQDGILWGLVAAPTTALLVVLIVWNSTTHWSGELGMRLETSIAAVVFVGLTVGLALVLSPVGVIWAALGRRLEGRPVW